MMNRMEFFKQLERELQGISEGEANEVLAYYNEYFDEAGIENESAVLQELGSPEKIVAQLKAESAVKKLEREEAPTVKKGVSAIWLVVLAIFAAPIALPLGIAAVILVLSLSLTALAVVLSLAIAVIAALISGIFMVGFGLANLFTSIPMSLMHIGIGLAALGVSLLLGIVVIFVARGLSRFIAKIMNKFLKKVQKGEQKHA